MFYVEGRNVKDISEGVDYLCYIFSTRMFDAQHELVYRNYFTTELLEKWINDYREGMQCCYDYYDSKCLECFVRKLKDCNLDRYLHYIKEVLPTNFQDMLVSSDDGESAEESCNDENPDEK